MGRNGSCAISWKFYAWSLLKRGLTFVLRQFILLQLTLSLLDQITNQDVAEKMTELYEQYGISPDRVANVVAFAIDQPEDTNVNEFTIGPTTQPW